MIGNMFKHILMIDKSISVTFELIKLGFSGSDQMPLNTLQWRHPFADDSAELYYDEAG